MRSSLRAAALVLFLGFLVVWLIGPFGNRCPDRGVLPRGSSTTSSPSFVPPGTRTCTYTTPEGTRATVHIVPWPSWLALALLATLAAGAVRLTARDPRAAGELRARRQRPPRNERHRSRTQRSERDASDRERARRERAERARGERG
jgi:hypothetical protein